MRNALSPPTHNEIRHTYQQGLGPTIDLFDKTIQESQVEIQNLRDQLNKTSQNSSKPPSSDGLKKPPRTSSLREKGSKKNGGQKGHTGHTLKMVENPDNTVLYEVTECSCCGRSLRDIEATNHKKRQEFDIPPVKIEVTEHQAQIKTCPYCKIVTTASFPPDINSSVQYGNRIKSLAVYLNNYHFIPLERTSDFFEDVFGHRISQATILQANLLAEEKIKPANEAIKQQLINADVVHFDESGSRVNGILHWLHVASTQFLTYYGIHKKRGKEAMDDIGIIPYFTGIAMHDAWAPYFSYTNMAHALCNAHHLRELKFIDGQYNQEWDMEMFRLLLDIKKEVDKTSPFNDCLDDVKISKFEKQYDQIIEKGLEINPPPPPPEKKKRGRVKQSPPKNLLDRLKLRKEEVLLYMHDFSVPFDNNQGERDIRMIKVKQKVSGSFRTMEGARIFCSIRGYISTARKNGCCVIDAIRDAFDGKPFIPSF